MSFASPWRLLLIVAPLVLLVAYIVVQRTRRKYALRFTSVDLLASVAPRRPGWQRHVSAVLMLVALLALVVGLARPTRSVRVAKQRGTIMLAIDTSGSMAATDVTPAPARRPPKRRPGASSRSCRRPCRSGCHLVQLAA